MSLTNQQYQNNLYFLKNSIRAEHNSLNVLQIYAKMICHSQYHIISKVIIIMSSLKLLFAGTIISKGTTKKSI